MLTNLCKELFDIVIGFYHINRFNLESISSSTIKSTKKCYQENIYLQILFGYNTYYQYLINHIKNAIKIIRDKNPGIDNNTNLSKKEDGSRLVELLCDKSFYLLSDHERLNLYKLLDNEFKIYTIYPLFKHFIDIIYDLGDPQKNIENTKKLTIKCKKRYLQNSADLYFNYTIEINYDGQTSLHFKRKPYWNQNICNGYRSERSIGIMNYTISQIINNFIYRVVELSIINKNKRKIISEFPEYINTYKIHKINSEFLNYFKMKSLDNIFALIKNINFGSSEKHEKMIDRFDCGKAIHNNPLDYLKIWNHYNDNPPYKYWNTLYNRIVKKEYELPLFDQILVLFYYVKKLDYFKDSGFNIEKKKYINRIISHGRNEAIEFILDLVEKKQINQKID